VAPHRTSCHSSGSGVVGMVGNNSASKSSRQPSRWQRFLCAQNHLQGSPSSKRSLISLWPAQIICSMPLATHYGQIIYAGQHQINSPSPYPVAAAPVSLWIESER
jgi:hypothetical protein